MMITRQDYPELEDHPNCINVETLSNSDILRKFPDELRHLINELVTGGKIGNCTGNIQITSLYNFHRREKEQIYYADSFTLRIPFAGQSLLWEIMFSHQDLLMAPDIIFDDDSFFCGPQLLNTIKTNVPSLSSWNPYDSTSLRNLIREYFLFYKKHNVQKLSDERYSRFNFEYSSLVGETGIGADEVEVLIEPNGVVHFLISIPVDFSPLPIYVLDNGGENENPGTDVATLSVTYQRLDGSKIQPFLHLSPHIEQVLGNTGNKCIPPYNAQGCLMDYIPDVKKILNDKVEAIIHNHRMKNEFITYLLTKHSCSIIEYDTFTFSKITLLFQNKNFYWLLIIHLGNRFPQERPKITLRSVYHLTGGTQSKPYTEQLSTEYPYSPRWAPDEMVQRILVYTFENISSFQNTCKQKSTSI